LFSLLELPKGVTRFSPIQNSKLSARSVSLTNNATIMIPETDFGQVNLESNLKQFLLVLSVSLSVATLSQTVKWLRQIPYTLRQKLIVR